MPTDLTGRIGPEPIPGCAVPGTHIWGWMSLAELQWLHDTATTMGSVAEVGSLHGRSAYALAAGCPGLVWCVDPWDDPDDVSYPGFVANTRGLPNIRAVRGRSPDVARLVPDVDMVFIDGDHEYGSVVADIEAWLPKARRLLCGHDYNHPGFPGVRRAVDELLGGGVRPAVGDGWGDGQMSIWVYVPDRDTT